MSDPPSVAPASRPAPPALRRHAPKIVLSLVLAGGFAWMLHRGGLPLVPPREAFARLSWWAIPAFVLVFVIATLFRTHRWVHLLRPIGDLSLRRVLAVGFVGIGAIMLAPLRMGELVRPYFIAQRGRVSFTQAIGTIGAERVVDGLVLSLLLFYGLLTSRPLSPLPDHLGNLPLPVAAVPASAWAALVVFGSAFAAMAVFSLWRRQAHRVAHALIGLVSVRVATVVTDKIEKLADGLHFLRDPGSGVPFVVETLLYWAANAGGMWLLLRGAGFDATLSQALVTMGVLGVGILLPAGPGFFGAYQLANYCALAMFFPEGEVLSSGSAYVFLLYVGQLVVTLVFSTIGLAMGGGSLPEGSRSEA